MNTQGPCKVSADERSIGKNGMLVSAAGRGDYAAVDQLLADGADVGARYPPPIGKYNNGKAEVMDSYFNGPDHWLKVAHGAGWVQAPASCFARTAVQAAAEGGHKDVVKLLINAGADINAPPAEMFGRTALQAAAESGHQDLLVLLIQTGAELNASQAKGYGTTALQAAAAGGYREMMVFLLKTGADVNAPPAEDGRTALQAAAAGGHEELVRLLLAAGAYVNAPPAKGNGRTALQAAAAGGHQEMANFLLEAGADVNTLPAEDGRTSLQAAAEGGYKDLVALLMSAGADVNAPAREEDGKTALQAAAAGGHKDVVALLIEAGANVNAPPAKYGRTALQEAAGGGYRDVVALLIKAGADVDAPAREEYGERALQAAAAGGHKDVVALLIESGANVNAPAAHVRFRRTALEAAATRGHKDVMVLLLKAGADVYPGRRILRMAAAGGHQGTIALLLEAGGDVNVKRDGGPALQAAAAGGHQELVAFLLKSGVNVNAPPEWEYGSTALQAAAANGHQGLVTFLLKAGADVNAPAAKNGKPALQAAAAGGHNDVVALLIEVGAHVNALPVGNAGMTALQAAAAGGHQDVVVSLIDAGANVNAPAARHGKTALQAAREGPHEEVLKLLKKSFVSVEKNYFGQTVLHQACKSGDMDKLRLLLDLKAFDINTKDYLGATPLHIAVRGKQESVVEILMNEGANVDIRDDSGETPLQVAIKEENPSVLGLLLGNDANGLFAAGNQEAAILCQSPAEQRLVQRANAGVRIQDLRESKWTSPSLCLFSSISGVEAPESPVDPRSYLKDYCYPGDTSRRTVVEWVWFTIDKDGKQNPEPMRGIPNSHIVFRTYEMSLEMILVGYVCFDVPVYDSKAGGAAVSQDEPGHAATKPFQFRTRRIEISWIMRGLDRVSDKTKCPSLRSVSYRATLNLKYLSIPSHGVEFFTLFLDDVHDDWMKLLGEANLHLSDMRDDQLSKRGKDPSIIQRLLEDSQLWVRLSTNLQHQLSKSNELLRTFKEHDILHAESMDLNYESETIGGYRPKNIDEHKAMVRLLEKIKELEKCGVAISNLGKVTKEMIDLELSLASVYEARRSFDILESSLASIYEARRPFDMLAGMKRLSWITFIFLPLMFASSSGQLETIVNVLKNDPNRLWYIFFATTIMTLIDGWINNNTGQRSEPKLNKISTKPIGTSGEPSSGEFTKLDPSNLAATGREPLGEAVLGRAPVDLTFASSLRRRQRNRGEGDKTDTDPTATSSGGTSREPSSSGEAAKLDPSITEPGKVSVSATLTGWLWRQPRRQREQNGASA